jgi:hypothetical protein
MGVNLTSTAVAARVPNGDAAWLRRQAQEKGVNVSNYLATLIAERREGHAAGEVRRPE